MCVKHIIENLKKNHAKKELLKPLVWGLAWSYSPSEFEENSKKLREYDMREYDMSLYSDVMKEQPKSWSRAFYRLESCCEDVDNNATESFNSTITKARAKAMVPKMETIRQQAMQRISKRHKKSTNHQVNYSKYVIKLLAKEKEAADKCRTYSGTHGLHEVVLYGNSYRVNLARHSCTCFKWQIRGIPCEHAYGAMISLGLNVEDYVSTFFSTFLWQMNYETAIIPLRGPRIWMNHGFPLITAPPEPTLLGRKKKRKQTKFPRIKGTHESPKKNKMKKETLGRGRHIIHCSKCREAGYNSAGCKKYPKNNMKKDTIVQVGVSIEVPDTLVTQPTQSSSLS